MRAYELIYEANTLADESLDNEVMLQFLNQCTAKINIRVKAIFPDVSDVNEEIPLPNKWARSLYIPYMAGCIKQQDSSQFEYSDHFAEFDMMLGEFIAGYTVPDKYIDKEGWEVHPVTGELIEPSQSDIFERPPLPWFRRW